MKAILDALKLVVDALVLWVRGEPATVSGLIAVATTLALTLSHGDYTIGAICAAVEAVGVIFTRQLVYPSVKLPAAVIAAVGMP